MTSLRLYLFTIAMMAAMTAMAQQPDIDRLKSELRISRNDTLSLILLGQIANGYSEINPDSAYQYAMQMLLVTRILDIKMEEGVALGEMGYALFNMGNYPRALQTLLQSMAILENHESEKKILPSRFPNVDEFTNRSVPARMQRISRLSRVQHYTAILYGNTGNYPKALRFYNMAIPLAKEANNLPLQSILYTTMGRTYLSLQKPDSAILIMQQGYDCAIKAGHKRYVGSILLNIGRVYLSQGEQFKAKEYFERALIESTRGDYFRGVVASHLVLAEMARESGRTDSCLYHIRIGLSEANQLNAPDLLLRCYTALASFYKSINSDSTVKYQSLIIKINNETFNAKQIQQFQNIDFDEEQRVNEIEMARKEFQSQLRTNILLGSTFTLLVIAFFLIRNNRSRQKAKQKVEVAYEQLKATQSQLIQSEKMASLGELTAGIAHEIQNPLNFVNNFSEVNEELLSEMKDELDKGNIADAKSIANNAIENQKKILHHGKRADSIVKGMLQHSRSSSGVKEPTDINALVDEYLRLAYHGLRAKDKSFNAAMKTDFDETIGKINIVPQDIGRVILNLITNACYAVTERKSALTGLPSGQASTVEQPYVPVVSVSTKKIDDNVLISVKDNGNGIPEHIKEKIFQPFFTTKPTGQGTGLGLSMSYDIIKNTHQGDIKVDSKDGEGTAFVVILPIA